MAIKTHDDWVARVEFLHEIGPELAQLAKFPAQPQQEDINVLHEEFGYHSEEITLTTGRAVWLHLTGIFNSCEG